jgi:uncharacterized protein YndB with AHSA1/START domain
MEQQAGEAMDRGLTIQRTIRAPRERVYEAFLDPAALARWFGPDGFQTDTHEMDVRTGGLWRFTMTGPDGTVFPNWVEYLELTPPQRIVWDQGEEVGGEAWFRTTITFDEVDDGTQVVLQTVFPTREARDKNVEASGAVEGGKQTLRRLATYVEGS